MIKLNKIIILLSKLTVLVSLFSCSSQTQTVIIYEPMGIMDKPLPHIEIGGSIGNDKEIKYFVLDKQIINKLSRNIENNVGLLTTETTTNGEFGVYKITVLKNDIENVYLLNSRKESIIFFKNQLKIFEKHTDVYKEFDLLIKRIDW